MVSLTVMAMGILGVTPIPTSPFMGMAIITITTAITTAATIERLTSATYKNS